jgi:hypothetical protein
VRTSTERKRDSTNRAGRASPAPTKSKGVEARFFVARCAPQNDNKKISRRTSQIRRSSALQTQSGVEFRFTKRTGIRDADRRTPKKLDVDAGARSELLAEGLVDVSPPVNGTGVHTADFDGAKTRFYESRGRSNHPKRQPTGVWGPRTQRPYEFLRVNGDRSTAVGLRLGELRPFGCAQDG